MNLKSAFLIVLAVFVLCTITSAQGRQASIDAATKWRTAAAKAGSANLDFRAIGVAAQRGGGGIDVNIAVLVSGGLADLGPMTYSVQAVSVIGNETIKLGKPAQLTSSAMERMAADSNGIVATPQINIADLPQANAVEITVKGLSDKPGAPAVITVPLASEIKTAALGWMN